MMPAAASTMTSAGFGDIGALFRNQELFWYFLRNKRTEESKIIANTNLVCYIVLVKGL